MQCARVAAMFSLTGATQGSAHLFSVLADKHQVILISAQQLRMIPTHNDIIWARRSCSWIIRFAMGGIQLFLQYLCKSNAKGLQLGPSLHFTGRQFPSQKGLAVSADDTQTEGKQRQQEEILLWLHRNTGSKQTLILKWHFYISRHPVKI